jgi:hypothetical protein
VPQVFHLHVNRTNNRLSTNIVINGQQLDVKWDLSAIGHSVGGAFYATVTSSATQVLNIRDELGSTHLLGVSVHGFIATDLTVPSTPQPDDKQHIFLKFLAVDDLAVKELGLNIISRPMASENRLVKIYRTADLYPGEPHERLKPFSAKDAFDANPFEDYLIKAPATGPLNIAAEIESLLLLEAEAGDLNAKIATKKQAIAKSLKDQRNHESLGNLLNECDGVVCAAKVIAQRICDKMGIATEAHFDYVQVQNPTSQHIMHSSDSKPPATGSRGKSTATIGSGDRFSALHANGAAIRNSMEIIYPQSMLYKVLGVIATTFGLTALFNFIRRKCMSARKQVERLAEQEERRNARAYRRAARRAEMRKRWGAFLHAISCFRAQSEDASPGNYEEKRSLILQDAFLEQGLEAAEKGEVMEAEIRELRNANEIVSSLIRVDENRCDLVTPLTVSNPRTAMVPHPWARSRASTMTLPSYTSESLPDYRSRASAVSTDVESNISIDESTILSPTATSVSENIFTVASTGSTPRSFSPEGSTGTRRSGFTEISSILELSPRASEETLRTAPRSSMAWSRRSRDTNDL